jgi:hypothetical protein
MYPSLAPLREPSAAAEDDHEQLVTKDRTDRHEEKVTGNGAGRNPVLGGAAVADYGNFDDASHDGVGASGSRLARPDAGQLQQQRTIEGGGLGVGGGKKHALPVLPKQKPKRGLSRTMSEWKEVCNRSRLPVESRRPTDYVLVYEDEKRCHGADDAVDGKNGRGGGGVCGCCCGGPNKKELEECLKARSRFRQLVEAEGIEITEEISRGDDNHNVYLLLHTPFWRLCVEAERVGLKMPLKNCINYDDDDVCTCCVETFEHHLRTDDEDDYVSAQFRVDKLHLYKDGDNADLFFRPSVRSLLTYMILINIDQIGKQSDSYLKKSSVQSMGLLYMLHHGYYDDALTLHDVAHSHDPGKKLILDMLWVQYSTTPPDKPIDIPNSEQHDARNNMDRLWARSCRFQPLWKIRNYFGEKIALYFAWCGVLIMTLWPPLLFGIGVFIYGLYLSITKHEHSQSVATWDNATTADKAKSVVDNYISIVKESFDNSITPYYALILSIWGTVFLEIWKRTNATLAYEWDVSSFENSEPDRPQFVGTKQKKDPIIPEATIQDTTLCHKLYKYAISLTTLVFMVCLVFITAAAIIVYRIIMTVDYCTKISPVGCLITTSIVSALLNAVAILILGKIYDWLAVKLTDWENHRTQTEYDDSLIMKLFAFQFANSYTSLFYIAFFRGRAFQNGIFGLGAEYRDTCGEDGNCMAMLSFQVLILMLTKPIPKFLKDIILPALQKLWVLKIRPCCVRRCQCCVKANKVKDQAKGLVSPSSTPSDWEIEFSKPDLGDFTLAEYTEKVILYGFVMLFAASLSLAPLIALLILVIDIRVDAKRLLWLNRRPIAFIAQDIGMWYSILNFVNIIGVITNAFLVAFTSAWGNSYNITGQLAIVIGFEHIVFAIKFVIAAFIPDVPADVQLAIKRENYQIQKIMENGPQSSPQSRLSTVTEEDESQQSRNQAPPRRNGYDDVNNHSWHNDQRNAENRPENSEHHELQSMSGVPAKKRYK